MMHPGKVRLGTPAVALAPAGDGHALHSKHWPAWCLDRMLCLCRHRLCSLNDDSPINTNVNNFVDNQGTDTFWTVFGRNMTDCCMIYVWNVRALCAILISSKIEQRTDNHADQRGFCFLILKSETEIKNGNRIWFLILVSIFFFDLWKDVRQRGQGICQRHLQ